MENIINNERELSLIEQISCNKYRNYILELPNLRCVFKRCTYSKLFNSINFSSSERSGLIGDAELTFDSNQIKEVVFSNYNDRYDTIFFHLNTDGLNKFKIYAFKS